MQNGLTGGYLNVHTSKRMLIGVDVVKIRIDDKQLQISLQKVTSAGEIRIITRLETIAS